MDSLPYTFAAAATRMGGRHSRNEDRYRILDASHPAVAAMRRGSIYAVCDGVSTTPRGLWAAELTCARIDTFYDKRTQPSLDSLVQMLSEIDWELREQGKAQAACTLSLLWLADGQATILHVGDSQVYRVRHGEATLLTESHRSGRALGAWLGMGPSVADVVQIWKQPIFVGDLFLLVTDGVTEVVPPVELLDAWWAHGGSPQRAANAIIHEVERRQCGDDATAVVVDVLAVESDPDDENTATGRTNFARR